MRFLAALGMTGSGRLLKLAFAAWGAEIERLAVPDAGPARTGDLDLHAADRVGSRCGRWPRRGLAQHARGGAALDDLGQDAQRNLGAGPGADVQTGGCFQPR